MRSVKILETRRRRPLEAFFPGFNQLVEHREVVTPLDIERVVGAYRRKYLSGRVVRSANVPESTRLRVGINTARPLMAITNVVREHIREVA